MEECEHHAQILVAEDVLWFAVRPTGVPQYDFRFDSFFACRHPWQPPAGVTLVTRMGAATEYDNRYRHFLSQGMELINSPAEYRRSSELPTWYPLIADLTPRSVVYDEIPTARDVLANFRWPIFVKGERQTNRHNRRQAIIESPVQFEEVMKDWRREPILAWQRVVCREFVALRPVGNSDGSGGIPKSFEFRTFWWKGICVGIGCYWTAETYRASVEDQTNILRLGQEVWSRLRVPFLVIDIAQAADGHWLVIEVNDGQDSGYAGVNPLIMWRKVMDLQRAASATAC